MYLVELLISNTETWYVSKPVVVCMPKITKCFVFSKNDMAVFALLKNSVSTI